MASEKILEQKKQIVSDLSDKMKNSCAGVFVDYKGITVDQDTKLRKELREAGVSYGVIKNSILSFAVKDAGLDGLDDVLKGTTALAMCDSDYVAAAKILCDFAKKNDFFKIKAGYIDSNVIDEAGVKSLANLPSKEVLVAQLLGVMNGPIRGLATVLNGNIKGLAVALNAIAEKKSA